MCSTSHIDRSRKEMWDAAIGRVVGTRNRGCNHVVQKTVRWSAGVPLARTVTATTGVAQLGRSGIPRTLERAPRKRVSPRGRRAHTVSPKPSSPSAPCAVDSRGKKSRALVLEPSSGV